MTNFTQNSSLLKKSTASSYSVILPTSTIANREHYVFRLPVCGPAVVHPSVNNYFV